MKLHFFLLIVLISFNEAIAQFGQANVDQMITKELTDANAASSLTKFNKLDLSNIYLFENWENRGAIYGNQKKYVLSNINYNTLGDNFDAKVSQDTVYTFSNASIDSVQVNNTIFRKLSEDNKPAFFEVLYDSKELSFLKRHGVRIKRGKLDNITGETPPDRYYTAVRFFISRNGNMTLTKLNKKELAKFFGAQASAVTGYAKKNKLSFKKEKDVVKLFRYFNSL